jgi:hypothetical protein
MGMTTGDADFEMLPGGAWNGCCTMTSVRRPHHLPRAGPPQTLGTTAALEGAVVDVSDRRR